MLQGISADLMWATKGECSLYTATSLRGKSELPDWITNLVRDEAKRKRESIQDMDRRDGSTDPHKPMFAETVRAFDELMKDSIVRQQAKTGER